MAFISFEGKQALVTGAASGIGKEIVKRLVQYKAKVVALDINSELLKLLKEELPFIKTVALDVSIWSNVSNLNLAELGHVDLLVNCAGVVFDEDITKITEENVDKQFDVNIKAIINLTQKVVADLISRQTSGAIVNISSNASINGLASQSVYCATKGAVDAFTRASAVELGPYGIRVNSVNPTIVMTDLARKVWSDPAKSEPMLKWIPMGRFGKVEEIADTVAYLLSDKASMINGVSLLVDGGFSAH